MASDYSETNLKIDWRFFQWVSRQAFEQLTLSAVTARSGRLSQSATTLAEKKDTLSFILRRVMKIFLLFPVSESVLLLWTGVSWPGKYNWCICKYHWGHPLFFGVPGSKVWDVWICLSKVCLKLRRLSNLVLVVAHRWMPWTSLHSIL